MKSLLSLLRGLCSDVQRLHPGVDGLARDFVTIEARTEDEGLGFLSVALPAFGKAFDQSLDLGKMAHVPGFSRNKSLPKFLSGLTSLVFDANTGVLRSDAPVDAIVSIRQICYFLKKFLPSDSRHEHLERITLKKFWDDDDSILPVSPDRLERLSHAMEFVLLGLDEFQELECRHGPGAVMEGYSSNQKWVELDRGLSEFDHRLVSVGYDLVAGLASESLPPEEDVHSVPRALSARLVVVPKSCSALRTITVEPCLNQFVQQGLGTWLRDCISRCPVLSRSLALTSQVPNQNLALEGSLTGEWVTIDLSSASDLLSLQTVETAFARYPRFLDAVLRCRTPSILNGSDPKDLRKFAGMGNALTFPIQSVIFAMVAIIATVPDSVRYTIGTLRRAGTNVRVFGDDIIIRREHYARFADWITSFGLKINQGKTFTGDFFRESCGVDAFRGHDVTPVYLRHDPASRCTDPSSLASLVSTSNQLWLKAYYSAADVLKGIVEDSLGALPLLPSNSSGLGWSTRQDVTTYQRWSSSLHRFETRTYVPIASRRKDVLDGRPALYKYFHHPLVGRDDPTHLSDSVRRFSLNLRRRWVPSR
jgi:hypothetical protein